MALLSLLSSFLVHPREACARGEKWFTDLELSTEIPLFLGVRCNVESPQRLRFGVSVGVLPSDYTDIINSVVVSLGGYDRATAELIKLSLDDSLVTRFDLGWRPFETYGFYVQVGYRHVSFEGVAPGSSVAEIIDAESPEHHRQIRYEVASTLRMIDTELGWQWVLPWGTEVRAGLGFAATLSAQSEVNAVFLLTDFEETASTFLKRTFEQYAFSPTLAFALGHRFD